MAEYFYDKMIVPHDYGEPHCPNCGERLSRLFYCDHCRIPFDRTEIVYIFESVAA